MLQHFVEAIPAFQDNYIWAIHDPEKTRIIVVDPGASEPVLAYLARHSLELEAILLTHHHWDHSGGIQGLLTHFPNICVYGPGQEQTPIRGLTHTLFEGDSVIFPTFGLSFSVLHIPGHTLGHIAFWGNGILFCGDTLFSCGCGRVFEGTPAQMIHSLMRLAQLPEETRVYCGHEYTLANIRFAKTLGLDNPALWQYEQKALNLRNKNLPTLPSTLQEERAINPFLQCAQQNIIDVVLQKTKTKKSDIVSIFVHLREWKNKFSE